MSIEEQKEIFIMAGSNNEYDYFVRLNGLDKKHTHYLTNKNQLRGHKLFPGQVLKIGTWYEKDTRTIDEINVMIDYYLDRYYYMKKNSK